MANETISVVYEPLSSVAGKSFFHETLVYTNAAGEQFIATAFHTPGNDPQGNFLGNFSQASNAAATGGQSVYGNLEGVSGSVNDPNMANTVVLEKLLAPTNPSEVVASAADLSAQWNTIVTAENEVFSENLAYSPLTQNSNSVATTAITAAGLAPPADTGLFSDHWAPASGNVLATPMTSASIDQTDAQQAADELSAAEQYTGYEGGGAYAGGDWGGGNYGGGGYYGGGYYGGGYYGYGSNDRAVSKKTVGANSEIGAIGRFDAHHEALAAGAANSGARQGFDLASATQAFGAASASNGVLHAAAYDGWHASGAAATDMGQLIQAMASFDVDGGAADTAVAFHPEMAVQHLAAAAAHHA